jgi:AbrB family looped-hinge helix DNA binding protein
MNSNHAQRGDRTLIKMRERGQVTLPPEARKALKVESGDYLEAEVVEGGVLLKPVAVVERTRAWDELLRILTRPKWRGSAPEPGEDEVLDVVVAQIKALRREHEGSAR